jgi:O-succinylbenzoic acid--CoA ligase
VSIAGDGEIYVNGPTVVGEWDTLRTGDLGRLDEEGRLIVVGRKSDTIVSGGENVAPAEVEAVLEEHPEVAEAGVFGRPDPQWGEAVTARIVPRGDAVPTAAALRAHCAERLAGYKVPKAFELAEQLPRTASGKLLRRNLT